RQRPAHLAVRHPPAARGGVSHGARGILATRGGAARGGHLRSFHRAGGGVVRARLARPRAVHPAGRALGRVPRPHAQARRRARRRSRGPRLARAHGAPARPGPAAARVHARRVSARAARRAAAALPLSRRARRAAAVPPSGMSWSVALWDGRIDARDDLARALAVPAATSDVDLVRLAFEKWGEDAPAHIVGDFAIAVRDGERVILARDRFGLRPLD